MKICPKCNVQMNDELAFCPNCGNPMGAGAPVSQMQPQQQWQQAPQMQPIYDPYDHTAEYDPRDISENKVMAMLPYLMGTIGIIIALLASRESAYTYFHVRQALKLTVASILLVICTVLLFWTIIVPIAAGICSIIIFVLEIIAFFQVCGGKAKEPAIIRSLGFFR